MLLQKYEGPISYWTTLKIGLLCIMAICWGEVERMVAEGGGAVEELRYFVCNARPVKLLVPATPGWRYTLCVNLHLGRLSIRNWDA